MMVYNQSDSDGTDDDDLPPTQVVRPQGRKGRPSGNGKPSSSFYIDQQIRQLELDAYHSLLRAFSAQSEVITWSKEGLMSDMRKELRVADEQHREMLGKVSHDETLRRIRHWRSTGEDPGAALHHRDTSPSPAVSQSRKRQKVGNAGPILPPPVPVLKAAPQSLPSASGGRGLSSGKKSRSKGVTDVIVPGRGAASVDPRTPGPPSGRGGVGSGRGATPYSNHKGAGPSSDSRVEASVGRRLRIRWPEDNIHYEAVVVDYNKDKMLHCLAYDSGTPDESIEWVDLKAMDRKDIQWLDPRADPVILDGKGPNPIPAERGAGRGMKRGRGAHGGVVGRPKGSGQRGRPAISHDKVVAPPTALARPWRGGVSVEEDRNGTDDRGRRTHILYPDGEIAALEKSLGEMEHTKDVGKLENARQLAKDYEEALQKALVALSDYSMDDGREDEKVDVVDSPVHSMGLDKEPHSHQETGNRQEESEDEGTGGERRDEGSEGNDGGAEREGGSDAELDNADDDGDGDDR